jgi:redox-sensing transcriptional repressor
MKKTPINTVHRLVVYRKILQDLIYKGERRILSKELAQMAACSAEQVRSDLMFIKYNGRPYHGYNIQELEFSIGKYLDNPAGIRAAIIGFGRLGSLIYDYCWWNVPNLSTVCCFDVDESKIKTDPPRDKFYLMDDFERVTKMENLNIAILTVPSEIAQKVADRIVSAGINLIINYTTTRLVMKADVLVDDLNLLVSLDKLSFFSKR